MKDYHKYINALRKCAKEHEHDILFTGHIIVSDLCKDTANLLEGLKQELERKERKEEIEEAIKELKRDIELENDFTDDYINAVKMGIKALEFLEQESCKMTAEEYRQRMMHVFHKTDCDELIALCVPPTKKEFEHLEWLLKNHYKKESYKDNERYKSEKRGISKW